MLFDEVTSALDPEVIGEVTNVIRKLVAEFKLTMLMVTHQMGFAKDISDRVCFFYQGKIEEQGAPDELFGNPQRERTQQFLSAVKEAVLRPMIPLADFRWPPAETHPRAWRDATRRWCPRPSIRQLAGHEVLLKLETCQPIGAFKLRGALNAIADLPEGTDRRRLLLDRQPRPRRRLCRRARGACAPSSACPTWCRRPRSTASARWAPRCASAGRSQDEALAAVQALCAATKGWSRSRPSTIPQVIAGQGTIGLELIEARPDLDADPGAAVGRRPGRRHRRSPPRR